jgi:pimeloyl-ACP methyl ester carboxylesterase
LIPYYWTRGIELGAPDTLAKAGDLRTYAPGLRANPNVRLIVNQDDFLLPAEDLAWLKTTFAADQLTVFEQGGHLGNLSHPEVQKAILAALASLQSAPPKPH